MSLINSRLRAAGVQQPAPVDVGPPPASLSLGLALALDAQGRVGKSVQACHGNRRPTTFTNAILPFPHPLQSDLNTGQFAALNFRKPRADFVLHRV